MISLIAFEMFSKKLLVFVINTVVVATLVIDLGVEFNIHELVLTIPGLF